MPSFNITANGQSASQVLAQAATVCLLGKTLAGAVVVLEASKDNTIFAPATFPMSAPGVSPITLPAGWYVRVVTNGATPTTNAQVEVA